MIQYQKSFCQFEYPESNAVTKLVVFDLIPFQKRKFASATCLEGINASVLEASEFEKTLL